MAGSPTRSPRTPLSDGATSTTTTITPTAFALPAVYRLFFLTIEPISALAGAYYAYAQPATYISLLTHTDPLDTLSSSTSTSSALPAVTHGTTVALAQLANLYFLFALNEALVLRVTSDQRVWRAVLFGLLIADIGHLWSVLPLRGANWELYWRVTGWNAMDWGNVGFVYVGAAMRCAFLSGVGLGGSAPGAGARAGREKEAGGEREVRKSSRVRRKRSLS